MLTLLASCWGDEKSEPVHLGYTRSRLLRRSVTAHGRISKVSSPSVIESESGFPVVMASPNIPSS